MADSVLDSFSADKLAENLLRQFVFYEPTPKQKAFHDAGLHAGERLFLGGNRTGKTNAVCMEMAMHLTGTYPAWWQGYRFRRPINAISASISSPEGGLSALIAVGNVIMHRVKCQLRAKKNQFLIKSKG